MSKDENVPPEVSAYFRAIGKRYGARGAAVTNANLTTAQRRKAGKKAAAALSPAERSARASIAAKARWAAKKGTEKKAAKKGAKKTK
jgi:hypothetical protein